MAMVSLVKHTQGFGDQGFSWSWGLLFTCVMWSETLARGTHLILVGETIKVKFQFLTWEMETIILPLPVQWPVQRADPKKVLYSQACSGNGEQ